MSLTLDEDNNIYVLDIRESNIKVFNDQGKFLRSFGRMGAGPGELDGPGDFNIFRRNEIAVKDTRNRRITFYSLGGEYKRSLSTARFNSGKMEIDSKGNIFINVVAFKGDQRRIELQKFDSNLNYIKTFDYRDAPIEKEIAVFYAGPCFAILKGDFIAYGSPEKNYEIKIYDNNGTLIKRILKDCPPERIPQKEINFFFKGRSSRDLFYIPEYYSPYYYIFGDSEGRIITLQRYKLIEKVISFDVFSPEGKHLATKNFEADFYEYGCLWRNNKLYVIGKDKEELPVVKVYQLKWNDRVATH
ncbi:MAG: 6-bladed beta-propeller [Methanosarcinaceae archaeon]|nr:6-bladed beta-propeller [Methanosarcinaceae archaeon]